MIGEGLAQGETQAVVGMEGDDGAVVAGGFGRAFFLAGLGERRIEGMEAVAIASGDLIVQIALGHVDTSISKRPRGGSIR
jgi:hypothetical protein